MRKQWGTRLLIALLQRGLVLDFFCRTVSILGRLANGKRFSTAHALGKLQTPWQMLQSISHTIVVGSGNGRECVSW